MKSRMKIVRPERRNPLHLAQAMQKNKSNQSQSRGISRCRCFNRVESDFLKEGKAKEAEVLVCTRFLALVKRSRGSRDEGLFPRLGSAPYLSQLNLQMK